MKTLILAAFLSMTATPAVLAQSSHGMDHSNMPMTDEQMDGAIHAKAVVNSIGDGTANVSHDPIPEIGWPAMTMDMTVLEGAQMSDDLAQIGVDEKRFPLSCSPGHIAAKPLNIEKTTA